MTRARDLADYISTGVINTELVVLDGVTEGTVTASKALVVDSNKDIASVRNVSFDDDGKAIFGGSNDLQIYHDGADNNSYIKESGTGSLYVDAANLIFRTDIGENLAKFLQNGQVQLFNDNAQKLATTSTGIAVTGDATFADNGKAIFGAGSDLQIYHDSATNHSIIAESGSGSLFLRGQAITMQNADGSAAYFGGNGSVATAYYGTSARLATTATGVDVTGTVTADGGDFAGELIADSYNETYAAVTSSTNATTVNCEAGNSFMHTLTENTTFTFSNPPASGTSYTMSIEIIQDASASGFVVTWPTSVDWPSATAPTLTATASAVDVFVFTTRDGGTTWYGFTAGQALG